MININKIEELGIGIANKKVGNSNIRKFNNAKADN